MPSPSKPLTFLSLYAGAGGMDKGFVDAGYDCLWANDFDPDATATHRLNLGGEAVAGDIASARTRIPRGVDFDVVVGGPPCQGFSVAGHMRPDDPRSRHVWTFLEIVEELAPRAFVMENVAALATNPRWSEVIHALRARAEDQGYKTSLWLLNASHYDVPQGRQRMFLVGSTTEAIAAPPAVTAEAPPTVRDVLASLPRVGEPGNDTLCTAIVTPAKRPVLRRSPFAGMLFNGKGRPLNLDAPASTLAASMGGNRTPIVDQDQLDGKASESWIVGYHRHLWDGGEPYPSIPPRMRRLTVEEAAAIQTFPRDWEFVGRQSAVFRQIGNAVPPRLAYHVARAVAAALRRGRLAAGSPEAPELLAA